MSTPNTPNHPVQGSPTQPTTPLPSTAGAQPTVPYPQSAPQQTSYAASAPAAYQAAYQQPTPIPVGTKVGETNTFAFLSIIFAFLSPIAGIVFGHMGLSQIKKTGDAGRGIALTGLIISYAYFVLVAIFVVIYVGMLITLISSLGALGSNFGSSTYDYNTY